MDALDITATLAFCSSLLDVMFSFRRVEKYGLAVELNPWIRSLAGKIDPLLACFTAVMLPSWLIIAAGLVFNWPTALTLYAGARLTLNYFQIQSWRLEKFLDEAIAKASPKEKG